MFGAAGLPTMPMMMAAPGQVLALRLSGTDSACGLCCYPLNGTAAQIVEQTAISQDVNGIYSLQELNEFIRDINDILQRTNSPALPTLLLNACIPIVPICWLAYASEHRQNCLKKFVDETNEKLKSRQCHWQLTPYPTSFAGTTFHSALPFLALIRDQGSAQPGGFPFQMMMPMMMMGTPMTAPMAAPMGAQGMAGPYGQPMTGMIPPGVGYTSLPGSLPDSNFAGRN